MATRFRAKDLPQPWQSSKKTNGSTQGLKSSSEVGAVEDINVHSEQGERRKRGRPPGKSVSKVVGVPKGMKKSRPLSASAVNVLLSVSQTSVANVEELRRKRKEDAASCGRVVQTISPLPRKKSNLTTVVHNSNEDSGDEYTAVAADVVSRPSPAQSSQVVPPTGPSNEEKERAKKVLEQAENESEPIISRRPGKEPVPEDADDGITLSERKDRSGRHVREHIDIGSDGDSEDMNLERRGRSPTTKDVREAYKGRRFQSGDTRSERIRPYGIRSDDSMSRSPRRKMNRSSQQRESWSPWRSDSGSPRRGGGRRRGSVGHDVGEYDKYEFSRWRREEHRNSGGYYSGGRRRRWQFESSSPESYRRHRRSCSQEHARSFQERDRTSYSYMSPPTRSMNSRDLPAKKWSDVVVGKKENVVETSTVSERKRRRREQAFLESQKAKRQTEGKKPFYMILDREGKPYGPGKPSWIAEVNKFAKGLDPSCTHIRKQTFEDVQTFKDRLDENFEYSGALNEDYLRALMGRAVTKRRTELISFIRNGGQQPKHIDKGIWTRLEKLATSEQRKQKSEQGRHANACRTVVGRTGRRGIDGVKEKLRSLLGRSPDPSEVEEEMQRDKGYGGRKRKNSEYVVSEENNSSDNGLKDEERLSRRSPVQLHRHNSDAINEEAIKCHSGAVHEEKRGLHEYVVEEVHGGAEKTNDECESFTDTETNDMTKDDYIEKLKAEIKLLQEEKAKMPTLDVDQI